MQINHKFRNWQEGTFYKSNFILQSLLKFRTFVVWLDIDTEVWQYPKLLFNDHDFAIYNWLADKDHHLEGRIPFDPQTKSLKCSGGVQKYGYTAPSINLLLAWIDVLKQHPNSQTEDDPYLDIAFNKGHFELDTLWLPKTYNRMDKHTSHWSDIPKDLVVINHDYVGGNHRIINNNEKKGF